VFHPPYDGSRCETGQTATPPRRRRG
jgi:hypothetical protein